MGDSKKGGPQLSISRDLFISIIDAIRIQHDRDLCYANDINKFLGTESVPLYNNSSLTNQLFKILQTAFPPDKDGSCSIESFCWELDFGRVDYCPTNDPGVLYDNLVKGLVNQDDKNKEVYLWPKSFTGKVHATPISPLTDEQREKLIASFDGLSLSQTMRKIAGVDSNKEEPKKQCFQYGCFNREDNEGSVVNRGPLTPMWFDKEILEYQEQWLRNLSGVEFRAECLNEPLPEEEPHKDIFERAEEKNCTVFELIGMEAQKHMDEKERNLMFPIVPDECFISKESPLISKKAVKQMNKINKALIKIQEDVNVEGVVLKNSDGVLIMDFIN